MMQLANLKQWIAMLRIAHTTPYNPLKVGNHDAAVTTYYRGYTDAQLDLLKLFERNPAVREQIQKLMEKIGEDR